MIYSIFIHDDAKIEIKDALDYYLNLSRQVGLHFFNEINNAIEILEHNPQI